MPLSIRAAVPSDTAAITALFVEVAALHQAALPHLHAPPAPAATSDYVASLLQNETHHLFVATCDAQVVGFVHCEVRQAGPPMVPRRYVAISNLALAAASRRRGIGRALMNHVHAWAAAQDIASIELSVYEFNESARAFYEALGYTTISRRMGCTRTL